MIWIISTRDCTCTESIHAACNTTYLLFGVFFRCLAVVSPLNCSIFPIPFNLSSILFILSLPGLCCGNNTCSSYIFDNEADEYNLVTCILNRFYMHEGGGMIFFRIEGYPIICLFFFPRILLFKVLWNMTHFMFKKRVPETESRWHIV